MDVHTKHEINNMMNDDSYDCYYHRCYYYYYYYDYFPVSNFKSNPNVR